MPDVSTSWKDAVCQKTNHHLTHVHTQMLNKVK